MNLRRCGKILLFVLCLLTLIVGVYILNLLAHDNFHVVSTGQVYRSGQMSGGGLARTIREHGIKCVINLRGESPDAQWYRAETNATHLLGVEHLDFSLSAGREVTDQEIESIMQAIRRAPKPVLIHCNGGADRAALISSLYLLTIEGKPAPEANRQLSPWYGHIPYLHWRYSIAMDHSFGRYISNHFPQTAWGNADSKKP